MGEVDLCNLIEIGGGHNYFQNTEHAFGAFKLFGYVCNNKYINKTTEI